MAVFQGCLFHYGNVDHLACGIHRMHQLIESCVHLQAFLPTQSSATAAPPIRFPLDYPAHWTRSRPVVRRDSRQALCDPPPWGPSPVDIGEASRSIRTRVGQHRTWIACRALQDPLVRWLTPDDEALPYDHEARARFEHQRIPYWRPWMTRRDNPEPGW
jgi:hypothetical protein